MSSPSAEYRDALLVLDDTSYLHVQPCDTGWDYTLYDVATMKQMDGGQLRTGRIWRPFHSLVRKAITAEGHAGDGRASPAKARAPLGHDPRLLQEAAYHQMLEQRSASRPLRLLPPSAGCPGAGRWTVSHAGPPALTQDDLEKCGYLDGEPSLPSPKGAEPMS